MAEQDEFRLDGKVALVTGGARGLGAECARVLAAAGAKVMVTDILEEAGAATVAGITETGGTAEFRRHDVTDEAAWATTVTQTIDTLGGFDILVNNAGVEVVGTLEDSTYEDFRRVQNVNVDGVYLGCRQAVQAMKPGGVAGRGGSIVNLSSLAGLVGVPHMSVYGASKGAVRVFTKDVAVECGRFGYGIRCNSVHPGLVETEMAESLYQQSHELTGASLEEVKATFTAAHPLGRLGTPRDIANAVRFLASEASSWITGVELSVDGGWAAS